MIALYCADVSAAFDRVSRTRLIAKLRSHCFSDKLVRFLAAWLAARTSEVLVSGHVSDADALEDSVFQGTVLGPPLWNLFCSDATAAIRRCAFTESVFADGLNVWKAFLVTMANREGIHVIARGEMDVQRELHTWGRVNQVVFEPDKGTFHGFHRRFPFGETFRILGVVFDAELVVADACRSIAVKAGVRLQALLHSRAFFTVDEAVRLYTSQIVTYSERPTAGIEHASPSVLAVIDRVQTRFLEQFGMTDKDALRHHTLAPLQARRSIAMLGLLHRVVLGRAPAPIRDFFPVIGSAPVPPGRLRLRSWIPPQTFQLHSECAFASSNHMQRPLFGTVRLHHAFPQSASSPGVSVQYGLDPFDPMFLQPKQRQSNIVRLPWLRFVMWIHISFRHFQGSRIHFGLRHMLAPECNFGKQMEFPESVPEDTRAFMITPDCTFAKKYVVRSIIFQITHNLLFGQHMVCRHVNVACAFLVQCFPINRKTIKHVCL